jgi:hypothetical protein
MIRFESEEAMAKLTKAQLDHLVKKHLRAQSDRGKICVTLTLECPKGCKSVIHNVHICRYPPCPC